MAAIAASCGSAGGTASSTPSPSSVASPSPTPSPTPSGFSFKLNGISTTAAGTVSVTTTATPPSVTVEVVVHGLQALSSHISHIHIGSCTQRGNIAIALKQVIADAQGNADVTTSIPSAVYPPANGTWYVVVHAGPDLGGTNATYLLCGNLFA
jgi:hypothetical protein